MFNLEGVRQTVMHLEISTGPGQNMLPNKFLKSTCKEISGLLPPLFNLPRELGVFPSKHSFITFIYKSGNRSSIKNYIGIACLSVIPQLLQKIVVKEMYDNVRAHSSTVATKGSRQ